MIFLVAVRQTGRMADSDTLYLAWSGAVELCVVDHQIDCIQSVLISCIFVQIEHAGSVAEAVGQKLEPTDCSSS